MTECLVAAVSRLVCKQTHTELSTLYIQCHEWNAAQNHYMNMANKSTENILEFFLMLFSKCFCVLNATQHKKP